MTEDVQADSAKAARYEELRKIVDRAVEIWPADAVAEDAKIDPELEDLLNEINWAISNGDGNPLARLLTENVSYRLLLDQEITKLPPHSRVKLIFSCGTSEYFASQAISWVSSCAAGRSDYLMAAFMTSLRPDFLSPTVMALLDAGAAFREGQAKVTLVPFDPATDDPDEQPSTTEINESAPAPAGE